MNGPASPARPLRDRVIGGLSWTLLGFLAAQALRLGSNLLLTRLLFPEAFGVMALVQIVIQGIEMFSDAGLRGSVVNHERGEDPDFLATVYSFQAIRGVLLWIVMSACAWPAADFYSAPELIWAIPLASSRALLRGVSSTSLLLLVRRVEPSRRIVLDLSSQLFGLVVMVGLALWVTRSVAVLVVGAIAAQCIQTAGSHYLVPTAPRPRFGWDPAAARSIFGFGKWIFLSTALTFVLSQAEKGVLGRLLSMSELGLFSIAFLIVQTFTGAVQKLSGNLLFPIYAELARRGPGALRSRMLRVRAGLLGVLIPPLWVLVGFGPEVVGVLYDDRYAGAGWMAQVLAAGAVAQLIANTAERAVLAYGDSRRHMTLQVARAALLVVGIIAGGTLGGADGVIVGAAVSRWVAYVPFVWAVRPYDVWMPQLDLPILLGSAVVAFLAFA